MSSLTLYSSLVDSGWNEVGIWRNPVLLICARSAEETYEALLKQTLLLQTGQLWSSAVTR